MDELGLAEIVLEHPEVRVELDALQKEVNRNPLIGFIDLLLKLRGSKKSPSEVIAITRKEVESQIAMKDDPQLRLDVKRAQQVFGEKCDDLVDALYQFREGPCRSDFGLTFLKNFAKKPVLVETLAKYGLQQEASVCNEGKRFKHAYFDSAYNFCLTYEKGLIGSLGFTPDEGSILINQIQGAKGKQELLKPFKWTKALLAYAVDWAQRNNIPSVIVQSAKNNHWRQKLAKQGRDLHQLKMLYDVTAQRSGFKLNEDGDYVKHLRK